MNKRFGVFPAGMVLVVLFALSACGNKGDLYVPKAPKEDGEKTTSLKGTKDQASPSVKTDAIP